MSKARCCDRCGAVYGKDVSVVIGKRPDGSDVWSYPVRTSYNLRDYDLCPKCSEEFRKFLFPDGEGE